MISLTQPFLAGVESVYEPDLYRRMERGGGPLREGPLTIYYRVVTDVVIVVAVAHQKRRPGYWSTR